MTSRCPAPPRRSLPPLRLLLFGLSALALLALGEPAGRGQTPPRRVKVTIRDEKPAIEEIALPVDPQVRAHPAFVGSMAYGLNFDGKRLTFSQGSARTSLRID